MEFRPPNTPTLATEKVSDIRTGVAVSAEELSKDSQLKFCMRQV